MSLRRPAIEDVATPSLRRALDRARADASYRGFDGVCGEILVRALIAEPEGAEIFRGAGGNVDTLDAELAAVFDRATPRPQHVAACDRGLELAVDHAIDKGATTVSIGAVLAIQLYGRGWQQLFARHGATRHALMRYIAHGIATPSLFPSARVHSIGSLSHAPTAGTYRVILHNDDYTPIPLVTRVLTSQFGKTRREATELAQSMRGSDHTQLGEWPYAVARRKVERAHRRAEKAGFPLLLSLEPA